MANNPVNIQHVIITHSTDGTGAVKVVTLLACVHTDGAENVGR